MKRTISKKDPIMMKITELINHDINEAVAYLMGLSFPLIKMGEVSGSQHNNKMYLLGSINHNHGKVKDEELTDHFQKVSQLFDEYSEAIELIHNDKLNRRGKKKGFSTLIEIDCMEENAITILTSKVEEIKKSSRDNKRMFARGCFDGRSSWDTTAHYLSIDVDRDYEKQNLVYSVFSDLGIELNLNRRETDHNKNDQLRIKENDLRFFLNDIGLFSINRYNAVENGLNGRYS